MEAKIRAELKKIEAQEKIKILYAVESGSRAWGFPSKDSDYDVRFIYLRPLEWYVSVEDKRDVLEYPISDLLDISGWDLRKALQLLRKSNPSLIEWLDSPIVYQTDNRLQPAMDELLKDYLSEKKLMYHYYHMAKGNFKEYLQGNRVRIKKYFYVLRPLLACMWIEEYHQTPPMLFKDLLTIKGIPNEVLTEINQLLTRKKAGDEMDLEEQIPNIHSFIQKQLSYYEGYIQTLSDKNHRGYESLNRCLRDYLEM